MVRPDHTDGDHMTFDSDSRTLPWHREWASLLKNDPVAAGFIVLAFLMPFIGFVSSRAVSVLLPLFTILMAAAYLARTKDFAAFNSKAWFFIAALLALVAVTGFWAFDPGMAAERFGKIFFFTSLGLILFLLAGTSGNNGALARKALMAGTIIAVALYSWAVVTEGGLYTLLSPDSSWDAQFNAANKPANALVLLTGAIFIAAAAQGKTLGAWMLIAALFIVMFFSPSQSSLAGMAVWIAAYGIARGAPGFARQLTSLGGAALILAMPFLFAGLFALNPDRSLDWQAASLGARLDVYYAVGLQILQAPFLGHGIEAARFISDWPIEIIHMREGTFHHTHNGFLQLWLEFGLLGGALGAAGWFFFTRQVAHWSAALQPALIASLAAYFFVFSVTYGAWQSWWLSGIAMAAALTRFVARGAERDMA